METRQFLVEPLLVIMLHRMVYGSKEDLDPLLWCMSAFLIERLGKQKVTPIIRPGKSELVAEVIGGVFPTMFQALSRAGPSIMATPLLVRTLWQGLVSMPW